MVQTEDIIPAIQVDGNLNSKLLEKLMRKFELNKKLYVSYDEQLSQPVTTQEVGKEIYSQLAVSFCFQAYIQKDVRFYNAALKIADLIDIELPQIKF